MALGVVGLRLSVYADTGPVLANQVVPIRAAGGRLASVAIEVDPAHAGLRRMHAVGLGAGDVKVAEGTASAQVMAGAWARVVVRLEADPLSDRDGDGVPDSIDLCPDDGNTSAPCPGPQADIDASVGGDAGAGADARPMAMPDAAQPIDARPVDAPAADAGQVRRLDVGPDVPPDVPRPPVDIATPVDTAPAESPPSDAGFVCGQALLVTGTPVTPYDVLLRRRLEDLGCSVQLRGDSVFKIDDAAGKSVVVVSDTTTSNQVDGKLRDMRVGVFTLGGSLAPLLGMSGQAAGSDFGNTMGQQQLVITQPSHPLAAALTGVVDVLTTNGALHWAKPGASATVVATIVGSTDRAVAYAYEAGAPMVGLVAPARRVALGSDTRITLQFTNSMWRLFDAAARWAASHP